MSYERCTARTAKDTQCSREVAYAGADLCTQHGVSLPRRAGWYGMACFNGLSAEQQHRVVHVGNLPWGYEPEGLCLRGAEVEITTMWDEFPGPRFYCLGCAVAYLAGVQGREAGHRA